MGEHGYSSIGLVIGGTHIEEATEIRAKYKMCIRDSDAAHGRADDDIHVHLLDLVGHSLHHLGAAVRVLLQVRCV